MREQFQTLPNPLVDDQQKASDWMFPILLAVLVLVAYAPAFNNGFISDDYVVLGRLEDLKQDPLFLFSIPPETFRATCYGSFAVLKAWFGYSPGFFYAFTVVLHLTNTVMLWVLLKRLTGNAPTANIGAAVFAVYQNPQEAVMWLSGMNESLMTAGVLGSLLAWLRGRYLWFTVLYAAALFSKESAVAVLLLLPLVDYAQSGKLRFRKAYLLLAIPTIPFLAVYLITRNANALWSHGLYEVHPRAVWVFLNSFHRLLFPWGYLALLPAATRRASQAITGLIAPVAWISVSLAPYIFLTYQGHVPSRNQYLASIGVAWLLGSLVTVWPAGRWRIGWVAAMVSTNILYLWLVKDAQYVARAAPTAELLKELRSIEPQPVRLVGFPENPWIAANTALTLTGWQRSLLHVNESAESCPRCRVLVWDPRARRYRSAHPS